MGKQGMNQEQLQKMNRALVLRILRTGDQYSRAEIAKLTGLQPATITNIINDFQKLGLVEEAGEIREGRGRNAICLRVNGDRLHFLGIRLSRKYYLVGRFGLDSREIIKKKKYIDTNCAPFDVLQSLIKECHELIDYDREHEVVAIGVAVPGPYVRKRNRIVMMTGFRDWQEVHIEEELRKEFQIKVYMEHDANVGALSYNWSLGANENRSLIYVAAGQGVGAGIIIGGELFIGTTGTSGEIGHMSIAYDGPLCQCGNRGCLEKYCSSMALTKSLNNKIREGNYTILKEGCSFEDISDAVKQSDRLAVEEYEKACEKLSIGVVNLINAFNPDTIVIGDEIAAVDPELLLKTVQRITEERVLPEILEGTEIIAGKEDNDEILRGAGILAINEMLPDFLSGKRSLPEPEV